MCTAKEKKPTPTELHLGMRRREKNTIHIERYLCVRQTKKKPIGCLVGLGNLQGTQLWCDGPCWRDQPRYTALPGQGVWAPTTTIAMVRS